jgi:hypothetical protein
LYGDRDKPMTQSLVCFGCEFDSGWNDLVYELSEKLEKLIEKFIKENEPLSCAICGCEKKEHYGYLSSNPGKCLSVKKIPLKHKFGHKNWFYFLLIKIRNFIVDHLFDKYQTCWCEKYQANHPRALQMKEKMGTLSFYMTSGTNEMWDLIQEYEEKSAHICEICGKKGELNERFGWLKTLCNECAKKNDYRPFSNEGEENNG